VQGNLDPIALFAPEAILRARVEEVLRQAGGNPGHIFNVGHGIVPTTPVENVQRVARWVHEICEQMKDEGVGQWKASVSRPA
ncbi:MAG: uroporphyrinogen decarboxylase family protein, partial [Acidobacteriaceae bacterium]